MGNILSYDYCLKLVLKDADPFYYDVIRNQAVADLSYFGREGKRAIDKTATIWIEEYLQKKTMQEYGAPMVTYRNFGDYLVSRAEKNRVNPFLDAIQSVEWDGLKRAENFLKDMGCVNYEGTKGDYLSYISVLMFDAIIRKAQGGYPANILPIIVTPSEEKAREIVRAVGLGDAQDGGFATYSYGSHKDAEHFMKGNAHGIVIYVPPAQFRNNDALLPIATRPFLTYRDIYIATGTDHPINYVAVGRLEKSDLLPSVFIEELMRPMFLREGEERISIEDLEKDGYAYMLQIYAEVLQEGSRYIARCQSDANLMKAAKLTAERSFRGYDSTHAKLSAWLRANYSRRNNIVYYCDMDAQIRELLDGCSEDEVRDAVDRIHANAQLLHLSTKRSYADKTKGRYYHYDGWRFDDEG